MKYRSFNNLFDGQVRHSPFLPQTPGEQTAPFITTPDEFETSFQVDPGKFSGIRHCGKPGVRPLPPVHTACPFADGEELGEELGDGVADGDELGEELGDGVADGDELGEGE